MGADDADTKGWETVEQALDVAAGAALVLDPELRVIAATPAASALLGFVIPAGASAPKILCGDAPKRPFAEALAEGRPVHATLPHAAGRPRHLHVRAVPLGRGTRRAGTLVLLADGGPAPASGPMLFHGMWTQSDRMKAMFQIVRRIAGENVTVLVRGETGAGKELVARAIHELSPRRRGPFRAINCAALPPNLLESELFGHARGAFTGAVRDALGHVQLANKGTLFLDEVAELPLELQAKLLRVIETRTVIPVGARDPVPVDVRLISATHRSLRKEVEAGRFRADLMYRLRVIPVFLPPLRQRAGDIPLLVDKLREEMNATWHREVERVSPAALAALERHDWPGNVRELRNALTYAWAMGEGPELALADLPPELLDPRAEREGVTSGPPARSDPEAARIAAVLERAGGSRNRAAKILGVSRVTLWRRMRELGLLEDER